MWVDGDAQANARFGGGESHMSTSAMRLFEPVTFYGSIRSKIECRVRRKVRTRDGAKPDGRKWQTPSMPVS